MMGNFGTRPSLIVLVLSVLLPSIYGQTKSEREQRNYFGAVKTVRTEVVEYSFDGGKLRAGKRELDSVEKFDRLGNLLEYASYSDGEILVGEKYVFSSGRLIESFLKHSPFLHLPDKRTYEYDDAGNVIVANGYNLAGKLVNQSVYVYDEKNRKIQWTSMSYHPEERSEPHRWTYSYDEQGRLKEERAFREKDGGFVATDSLGSPHKRVFAYGESGQWETASYFNTSGAFVKMTRLKYDDRGNEIEDIEYDQNEIVKEKIRYEHKFDNFGNWIEERTYRWVEEGGKGLYLLEEVDYRSIKYFGK